MAGPKLTDWFNGTRKPVIPGVYERAEPAALCGQYSYFDGNKWGLCATNPERAMLQSRIHSSWQNVKWRGLAEQPKEYHNV